ncbi:X-domain of DnaJ-containing-domain-containing protein [Gloeopeniophorella convolvens]|nr:X-domain of DnaJ-containing-domain-containing protein [Gloeopeniophorella convolvens]
MASAKGGQNVEDPTSFFANVFGDERFMNYDMTSVAGTILSEEEKAEAAAARGRECESYSPRSSQSGCRCSSAPMRAARRATRTAPWEACMHREAEDLKLKSFGVELLHAIGTVHVTKASTFLKSKEFDIAGFWSRLKKGVSRRTRGASSLTRASSLSVQLVMQDIERAQLKGEVGGEELDSLEIDVTGKVMLASWRGTRFEVVQVLCECARPGAVPSRALLFLGAIFKSTQSDEERRELERMVAEVANPKKQAQPRHATQVALNRAHAAERQHGAGAAAAAVGANGQPAPAHAHGAA